MLTEEETQGHNQTAAPYSGRVLIPDVIRPLCQFLSVKDIKECRLVSKSWNYAATPVLEARTGTMIDLYRQHYPENYPRNDNVEEKVNFRPAKICILIGPHLDDALPPMDRKIFSSLTNLKEIYVNFITQPHSPWQMDLCDKIILTSSPTLVHLRFIYERDLHFPSLGGTVFPKLKELATYHRCLGEPTSDKAVEEIGHAITTGSFPGLEYLEIDASYLCEMSRMEMLQKFPKSLNSLRLYGDLTTTRIESLLKIPHPLKKLEFYMVFLLPNDDREDELPTALYNLLKKHAPTLENLYVDLWILRGQYVWKFPAFPVMKSFEIYHTAKLGKFEFESSPGNFERIGGSVCFPVLEDLCVFTESSNVSDLDEFLPNGCQVVDWVRKVVCLVHTWDHPETRSRKLTRDKIETRLMEIFPNAMREIR
ncbi:uncharacterized protein LOC118439425 [Folsomia candida]|uniref:uncharacterized protein LOC118439425 n=1 Tax=Folsomia candida TaxID=158441 RepID=UPI001604CC7F|nr:uncharacterized protein LOC118439425 [Folsomia candida]